MPDHSIRLSAVAATGALALCLSAVPSTATAFSGLVVFGDSLSDTGRVFAATGFPGAPYVDGRFSNGLVAAEYLATGLGVNNPVQFVNLAAGGAQTGTGGSAGEGTGMRSQVDSFIGALGEANADSGALYMLWGGSNDLLQAGPATLFDPAARTALITASVTNLVGEVQSLYAKGARSFLLPLLPDIGKTPYALNLLPGGAFSAPASQIAGAYNTVLAGAYGQLAAGLPDEQFFVFDTFAATNAAIPLFANATDECVLAAGGPPACSGYMFFDDRHPTTATHALLGGLMLAAVPEPGTMLMMAVGVAALLGLGRRRQRGAAA